MNTTFNKHKMYCVCTSFPLKGIDWYFGEFAYSLFCQELDEEMDTAFICPLDINLKLGDG